jgi:glycine cleavage system aminomethyltransferase T
MSALDEHLATRRAAGLFDFSFMGLYEFHGKTALQALQTRNLDALVPGQIAYTLLLKEDGAVLIDATVWRLDAERFWLFAGKRARYGGRDRSGEYTVLALQGPASGRILSRLIGTDAVSSLSYFHFIQAPMVVGRIGYSGELGYELLVPAADASALGRKLLEAGRSEGLQDCTWAAANSLRVESGYVLFDREVDGKANPRELGLERLAPNRTFDLKRRLVGLEMLDGHGDADLPPAQVTSECFSPTLGKRIGLAFVAPNVAIGNVVRAGARIARIAALPFYDPERRRPRENPL